MPIGALWGGDVVVSRPWLGGGVGCEKERMGSNNKTKLNRIFIFISKWFYVDKYDL